LEIALAALARVVRAYSTHAEEIKIAVEAILLAALREKGLPSGNADLTKNRG
jgi:hypothetical protein